MHHALIGLRAAESTERLGRLRTGLAQRFDGTLPEEVSKRITIFATGSLARLEANPNSDLDAFFYVLGNKEEDRLDTVGEVCVFHHVIECSKETGFPDFSNGGEYLHFQYLNEVVDNIGSRQDDYINGLTSRMLMILESTSIYNAQQYNAAKKEIIERYFVDFHDHSSDFRPIFILNDVLRFWRTLCLNYEHGREWRKADETDRAKGHLKNLKLRFSRLLICYSFVASLLSRGPALSVDEVVDITELTPLNRLLKISELDASTEAAVETLLTEYEWFLSQIGREKSDALAWISDEATRVDAFARARKFVDSMFRLVWHVAEKHNYTRYLVI